METKENSNGKSNAKRLVVSLVVLVVVAILGIVLGVFDGVKDLFSMVQITKDIILKLILALVFVFFASHLVLFVLEKFQDKRGRIGTLSTVLASIVKYVSALVGFCWGLSIIGVNVSTIFASVGIVALIIGFGAESLVADIVTGVFILFENQYNVGDIIEVDGFRGTVSEIGIRSLSLTDTGGNVKIINNSNLQNIINRSNQKSVAVCDIGVSYATDLEALEEKLPDIFEEIKKKYSEMFIGEIRFLGVEELGDYAIKLRFVAEVDEGNIFGARRVLNKELKIAFDKESITIPFPQVDVHGK